MTVPSQPAHIFSRTPSMRETTTIGLCTRICQHRYRSRRCCPKLPLTSAGETGPDRNQQRTYRHNWEHAALMVFPTDQQSRLVLAAYMSRLADEACTSDTRKVSDELGSSYLLNSGY